jgi:hypothetical protein
LRNISIVADHQAQSRQLGHVRADPRRVDPLQRRIDLVILRQGGGDFGEQFLFEPLGNQAIAPVPQRFVAKISLILLAHVQGVMPLLVKRQHLQGLRVGRVMHLLQNQNPQHHLRNLPRPAPIRVESLIQRRQLQQAQGMFAKHSRPRLLEHPPPSSAQMSPRVKQITGVSIASIEHADNLARP